MEQQHRDAIKKIVQLTKQDEEFGMELRKALEIAPSAKNVIIEDERLSHIYEYCIETNVRNQSVGFYSDFPLSSLIDQLKEDFIKMEFYHRKDNFNEFCLALYQQIEAITNKLCENKDLTSITEKMWGELAYVKNDYTQENLERQGYEKSTYQIAKLIFGEKAKERYRVSLQNLYANEKMKVIVYFLGYKTMIKNTDYNGFKGFTDSLGHIYTFRNLVHRGSTQTEWEQKVYDTIVPYKSFYYFKFLGVLAQYIEFVKEGLVCLPTLKAYAEKIVAKPIKLDMPKVLNKIELSEADKKKKRGW